MVEDRLSEYKQLLEKCKRELLAVKGESPSARLLRSMLACNVKEYERMILYLEGNRDETGQANDGNDRSYSTLPELQPMHEDR